jgi:Uma2 family endonuclease
VIGSSTVEEFAREVRAMSVTMFGRLRGTYTEEQYLALGETSVKIELFDGELVVSPPANGEHQWISRQLCNLMDEAVALAGLDVYQDIGVRLNDRRVAVPDIVVVEPYDDEAATVAVDHVRLVVEIVSRSNARMDRVRKMNYYAVAGIPFYLLIERYPRLSLRLFRLVANQYVEQASAAPGDVLELVEPVAVDIDTNRLARERVR